LCLGERQHLVRHLIGDVLRDVGEAAFQPLAFRIQIGAGAGGIGTDQVSNQMLSFAQTQGVPTSDADKDAEHDWLDSKFADLADRVQQSLDDMRQDNSLVSLDQRFDQFEQRLGDALDDMATRSDANGLKQVEAHIGELAQQIEQAQGQLGRLEQIEGQLTELMSRVSDERLGELMGQAGPSPADIENVATAVADRIATRLPQPSAHPTSADLTGFEDLRGLIQNFVEDQRQGEEHTASMLDTMQQAMIRVLDRMDALENGHTAMPKLAFSTAPSAQPMAAAAMPHNIAGERLSAQAPMPPAAAEPVQAGSANASTVAATRRNLQQQQQAAAAETEVKTAKPFSPPKAAAAPVDGSGPAKREDFIAGARRAARQPSAANPTLSIADDDKDDAPASRFGGIAKALSKGDAKDGSKLRPTLMVAAVTGLVAVGLLAATVTVYKSQGPVVTQRANAPVIDLRSDGVEPQGEKVELGKLPVRPNIDKLSNDVDQTIVADGLRQDVQLIVESQNADQPANNGSALNGNTIEGQIQDAPSVRTPGTSDKVLNRQGVPLGISVVQTNSLPDEQTMLRARQQQQMADMSSKLGQSQAQAQSVVQAQYQARNAVPNAAQTAIQNAIPTALAQPASTAADAELAGPAGSSTQMVELPPAFVGPMSLRVAAAKGDPSAAFEVAARLAEGRGVNQDFNLAMTWYQRSAQKGFAQAQYRLGTLYERGIGVKADLPRAKIWYARAAEQGNVKSMHNLAVLSAGRDAEATDYAVAGKWFIGAAQHGLADSQFNLGVLYESGLGVQRDPKQAYMWLSLAARSGDKEAAKRRDAVRASLPQQDAREVEAMVANWKAQPMDRASNDALAGGEAWKARQNLRQPG
jgi:localization factor PodJL